MLHRKVRENNMADIRPFRAVRPQSKYAKEVAALPYDVVSREEAKEEIKKHPLTFLKMDRPETSFSDDVPYNDPRVYPKAREIFETEMNDGVYISDDAKHYYIYELTMDGRVQTGIAAVASVDDYDNNVIKKHENTRAEKELDRINHVDQMSAQTGPIFLAYREDRTISQIVSEIKAEIDSLENNPECKRDILTDDISSERAALLCDFKSDDGIRHRVIRIDSSEDNIAIQEAFKNIDSIYIADGHHRAASAVKVSKMRRKENPDYAGDEEFNYFLSVLFPDNELKILSYNRVVKDLNGYSDDEFVSKLCKRFELLSSGEGEEFPAEKNEFSMYLPNENMHGGTYYVFRFREEDIPSDPVGSLDVSLLQNLLLDPILGIKDPRTDERIDFVGGIRGMGELVKRCHEDMAVAFYMYPTSISELFNVADAHLLMPPKSTWFEPKLRSGLFIHCI